MKLFFFKQAALNKLNDDISSNLKKYSDDELWINDYFKDLGFDNYKFDSGIEIDDFTLTAGDASKDAENAETLYNALNSKLSPAQASDLRLWAELAHNEFWDYMVSRWSINSTDPEDEDANTDIGRIHSRYFFGASKGKAFVRQGIARLYWTACLTHDDELDDPFEYTKYIFERQDILLNATERLLGRNRTILLAALKVLKNHELNSGKLSRNDIRTFFTIINNAGGIEVLDALEKDEAKSLCERILKEIINRPCIAEGSTITLRNVQSGAISKYKIVNKRLTQLGKTVSSVKPSNVIGLRTGYHISIKNNQNIVTAIN